MTKTTRADPFTSGRVSKRGPMLHKRILEWQAAHPNLTWVFWGIVWAVVLVLLLWPEAVE